MRSTEFRTLIDLLVHFRSEFMGTRFRRCALRILGRRERARRYERRADSLKRRRQN